MKTDNARIKQLEQRVAELERRPPREIHHHHYAPVPQPYYVPQPYQPPWPFEITCTAGATG
jgi:hypothetical protein